MRAFNEGAAYIAIKAGVPIVPVGMSARAKFSPWVRATSGGAL